MITAANLNFYKSTNMDSESTGGGLPTAEVVYDGKLNNVFLTPNRLELVAGDVNYAKCFAMITSNNDDQGNGSHFIITAQPSNNRIKIFAFTADNDADGAAEEASDMFDRLNTYVTEGSQLGDAETDRSVAAGEQQLTFKIQEIKKTYESVPGESFGTDPLYPYSRGAWIVQIDEEYSLPVDSKQNIVVENSTATTSEFAIIERIEKETQVVQEDSYVRHYIYYLTLHLARPLQNAYDIGSIIKETEINENWRIYSSCKVTEAVTTGDTAIKVESTRNALIPTILNPVDFTAQYFIKIPTTGDATINDTVYENIEQPFLTEAINATLTLTYSFVLSNPPILEGSVKIRYRSGRIWHTINDEGSGVLSGGGTVDYTSGLVSFKIAQYADTGSKIIVTYQREHEFNVIENLVIANAGSLPIELTFPAKTVKNSVHVYYAAAGEYWYVIDKDGDLILDPIPKLAGSVSYQTDNLQYHKPFYAQGKFIAPRYGNTGYYLSTNGTSWSTGATAVEIMDIAANLTTENWVYVSDDSSYIYYADSTLSWTAATTGPSVSMYSVCWADLATPTFFAGGASGNLWKSTDNGVNWTAVSHPGSTVNSIMEIRTGKGDQGELLITAVFSNGLTIWSNDGSNWYNSTIGYSTSQIIHFSCYENVWAGVFASNSLTVAVSIDGYDYELKDVSGWISPSNNWYHIFVDRDQVIYLSAEEEDEPYVIYSKDFGETWAKWEFDDSYISPQTGNRIGCVEGDGVFVVTVWKYVTSYAKYTVFYYFDKPLMYDGDTRITTVGDIDYITGVGHITEGPDVASDVLLQSALSFKGFYEIAVDTNGNDPIDPDGLVITVTRSDTGEDITLTPNVSNPAVLEGTYGDGVLSIDGGWMTCDFDVPVIPHTFHISYTMECFFHTEFDGLDVNKFPYDGKVPFIQTGDVVVIDDDTNEEMHYVSGVLDNDTILVPGGVGHDFAVGTVISSVLVFGDLKAKKDIDFDQESWDGSSWSDTQSGNPAAGSYDFSTYPLVMTNATAITDRWIVKIVSLTGGGGSDVLVEVYSQNYGKFDGPEAGGEWNISTTDIEPVNPLFGGICFSMDKDGFDGNWQLLEIQRFNTEGADPPVWLFQAIGAGFIEQAADECTVEFRTDVLLPPATWESETYYQLGDQVQPTTPNNHYYECIDSGESDTTEPASWPTDGGTVADGSEVVWQDMGTM